MQDAQVHTQCTACALHPGLQPQAATLQRSCAIAEALHPTCPLCWIPGAKLSLALLMHGLARGLRATCTARQLIACGSTQRYSTCWPTPGGHADEAWRAAAPTVHSTGGEHTSATRSTAPGAKPDTVSASQWGCGAQHDGLGCGWASISCKACTTTSAHERLAGSPAASNRT